MKCIPPKKVTQTAGRMGRKPTILQTIACRMLTHSKEKRVASDIETLIVDESENGGSGQQLSPGHVELSSVEGE
jgi:hypothetical protein